MSLDSGRMDGRFTSFLYIQYQYSVSCCQDWISVVTTEIFDSHSSHIQISPSLSEFLDNVFETSTCSLHEGTPASLEIKRKVYNMV
jgi:hypothetical protein